MTSANIEKIVSEDESATVEQVVRDCTEVWNVILKKRNQVGNDAEFLRVIHKQFPRLAESFPIVIRVMMTENFYDSKLATEYFEWVRAESTQSEPSPKQFLINQAEYYTRYYLSRNQHDKSRRSRLTTFNSILKSLEEEDREFRSQVARAQKEIEDHREEKLKCARQELMEMVREVDPVKTETDSVPCSDGK